MSTYQAVTPDAMTRLSVREMRRSVLRRWRLRLTVVAGWAAFVGVWYLVARLVLSPQQLPEPHVVATEAWAVLTGGDFGANLQASLVRVIGGFVLALLLSTGVGLLMAYSSWWRGLLRTMLLSIAGVPTVSFAILSLIVLGVSSLGPTLAAMLVATPYISMNVFEGITGVDRRLIVMSESFGRTRPQIFRGLLLPSAFFSIMGGIRLAFAAAWRMALLAEVFAASEGVGFQIRRSFESYDVRRMMAWTVLFIVIMLLFENVVFRQVERQLRGLLPETRDRP